MSNLVLHGQRLAQQRGEEKLLGRTNVRLMIQLHCAGWPARASAQHRGNEPGWPVDSGSISHRQSRANAGYHAPAAPGAVMAYSPLSTPPATWAGYTHSGQSAQSLAKGVGLWSEA